MVGDKTGCIILQLENEYIDYVEKDDVLLLRNVKINMRYNHFMTISIDKWGLIEKVCQEQFCEEINIDNNLSQIFVEVIERLHGTSLKLTKNNAEIYGGSGVCNNCVDTEEFMYIDYSLQNDIQVKKCCNNGCQCYWLQ